MPFMSHLINYDFILVLVRHSGFINLSFHNFISKMLQCDTWCSYTPLQLHVLYTISERGVILHVGLIFMLSFCTMRPLPPRKILPHMPKLAAMVTRHLPNLTRTLGLQTLCLTSTYTLSLAYVTRLRSTKCWCDTLELILVPLTHTRGWRNKLCPLLSYRRLRLRCPTTLGSLSLGAIPPHMSGLLAMVAHHLPILTGNPNSSQWLLGLRCPIPLGVLPP